MNEQDKKSPGGTTESDRGGARADGQSGDKQEDNTPGSGAQKAGDTPRPTGGFKEEARM